MSHQHEVPKEVRADRERVAQALNVGGFATITVRSKETGRHVTLDFSAKVKGWGVERKTARFVRAQGRAFTRSAARRTLSSSTTGTHSAAIGS